MNAVTELIALSVRYLELHAGAFSDLQAVDHTGCCAVLPGAYDDVLFCYYCAVSSPDAGSARGHSFCNVDEILIPVGPEVSFLLCRCFLLHESDIIENIFCFSQSSSSLLYIINTNSSEDPGPCKAVPPPENHPWKRPRIVFKKTAIQWSLDAGRPLRGHLFLPWFGMGHET